MLAREKSVWTRLVCSAWALLVLGHSTSSGAIVVRHDVADESYRKLAESCRGIVLMNTNEPGAPPDGVGTLVSPRWVVTAAHIAALLRPGHVVTVGGQDVTVADRVLHPEWNDGPHDIALVRLSRAVDWEEPVLIYQGRAEEGKVLIVAGIGDTGTGEVGATRNDGHMRAARNKVDQASELWLKMRFDPPDLALDLEGISGPGDSGGPGFIEEEGTLWLAGVSSAQSSRATGGRPNVYGVTEYYTRVSSYRAWLASVIADSQD